MGELGRRLLALSASWVAWLARFLYSRLLPFLRQHSKKLSAAGVLGVALVMLPLLWLRSLDKNVTLVAPPPTLLIEDVQGRFIAELNPDDRKKGYWPLPEQLPHRIVAATLAAEDARFYTHAGVDWRSTSRAFFQNLRHRRRVSGASTLAMQVARLQDPGGRTYRRKLSEALVARSLIKKYGHEAILRHYLKIAPYGNQYHGVVYAARRYLNKPLEDLTWAESALLAGLPRLPGRMNILNWKGRKKADRRAIHILGRLRDLKQISEAEYAEARVLLPRLQISTHETRPKSCLHAALAMAKELKSPADPRIQSEHYRLRSTLDLDLQEEIQYQAWKAMQKFRPLGAGNVSVLVAEKSTGRILAYLGSEDYFDEENAGAIDYAQTPRSSGSTLKPFIYAQGITERNFTAATLLMDLGMALNGPGGGYVIRNYDEAFLGPILYRNALANSRNVPAVQVLEAVGVERSYHHLCDLGLAKGEHEPRHYGVGLAIGGLYVTLKDLVCAYGVLANDGKAFPLRWFDEIQNSSRENRQLIPEEVARQVTLFLSDPMARLPSFPRMGNLEYPFAVALKTGTSQGYRDAWCVAYSAKYIVGVWMGHPNNYPMNHACGASSSAELVRAIMERLHPEEMKGLSDWSFPPPREWEAKRICMVSGKLASDDCPSVAVEWFKPGTEPPPEELVHRRVRVDVRTGKPATPECPPEFIRLKAFTVLDPRFTVWAKESGLELLPPECTTDPTTSPSEIKHKLAVIHPRPGIFLKDPESPLASQTMALQATVDPPAPQVVWYVDGKPFKVAEFPYTARWRMEQGTHTFQIRLPYAPLSSTLTRVTIKP